MPSTIPLPVSLVQILEAKHKNQGTLTPSTLNEWVAVQSDLKETIDNYLRYASHSELEIRAGNSAEALQRLNTALCSGSFEDATNEAFGLYLHLASYGALREQLRATTLEQTDKLIHACQACKEGRLPLSDVLDILPSAIAEIDVIVEYFRQASESLPEDVRQAILKGIRSSQVGFSSLQNLIGKEQADPQALADAAVNLRNGALILQELQSWGLELAEEERSLVPGAGDFVKRLRLEIAENGGIPNELMQEWNEKAFWVLQDRWSEDRHDFFMPRFKKDQFVAAVDDLMNRLHDLQQYPPQEQDSLLYRLEVKFEEITRSGFDMSLLRTHPLSWLADYIVAVLSKGVPRPHIETQINGFLGTDLDQYGRYLQSFLKEDDRDYLLDALVALQREIDPANRV